MWVGFGAHHDVATVDVAGSGHGAARQPHGRRAPGERFAKTGAAAAPRSQVSGEHGVTGADVAARGDRRGSADVDAGFVGQQRAVGGEAALTDVQFATTGRSGGPRPRHARIDGRHGDDLGGLVGINVGQPCHPHSALVHPNIKHGAGAHVGNSLAGRRCAFNRCDDPIKSNHSGVTTAGSRRPAAFSNPPNPFSPADMSRNPAIRSSATV